MRFVVVALLVAACHSGERATQAISDSEKLAAAIGAAVRGRDGEDAVTCADGKVVGNGYALTLEGVACPPADFWRVVLTTPGASLTDGARGWRRTTVEAPVVTFTTFTSKQRLEIGGVAYDVAQESSLGADVRVVNGPGVQGLTFSLGCGSAPFAGTIGTGAEQIRFTGCGTHALSFPAAEGGAGIPALRDCRATKAGPVAVQLRSAGITAHLRCW